ncbi:MULTISPECIES: DNA-binding protein [Gordonibacter]|uniref:DNA-binding protein n=1 Tax=Gordonibacter faecis TaxID=3047475 RepID=A0ABT7DLT1_9ACTN|nr:MULTISPECIES: DNA-binding protein [unclassified Gordonibacter]MDJ1649531.1 DNA-binding protein [Gordonibacter sp. KGMB12511]HIW76664.1 DNA-binding protein [Candidatus Gordonibacter avicola]
MSIIEYTLMNKNRPVLDFQYDLETHSIAKITDIHHLDFAPLAIFNPGGEVERKRVNDWWKNRAIPASRAQINQLKDKLKIESTLVLAEKNFGLSLSDRYWINDPANPQKWDEINFFDNDFSDDLGLITLGQDSSSWKDHPDLMSPNSTVDGALDKKWVIQEGKRLLVKSGSGFINQEVYNEVIATHLHRRLLQEQEYVSYDFYSEANRIYCACENMLRDDEELIPAWHLITSNKKPSSINDYQFLVSCYEKLGLANITETLSKMFVCDYLLGNFDRHWRNFGVIRNVETLEFTRIAPIFDTGNSLWCDKPSLDAPIDYEYEAKPFAHTKDPEKQLAILQDYAWIDASALEGFAQEAAEILRQNPNMPPARIKKIEAELERRSKRVV